MPASAVGVKNLACQKQIDALAVELGVVCEQCRAVGRSTLFAA